MKPIYVTFQIKPTLYLMAMGYNTKHYAIKCSSMDDAYDAASDINSFCGVTYIRINKCGRLRHKDTIVMINGDNYDKKL